MTRANTEQYALAQERVVSGRWTVDPEKGVIYGVKGRPFIRRNSHGYIQIKFRHPLNYRREVAVLAHRVIWETASGPVPLGLEINHRNGVKTDNRLDNLEAVTHTANVRHAVATGLLQGRKGSEHASARLSDTDVREIHKRVHAGERQADLATAFGISTSMVSNIKLGKSWQHLELGPGGTPSDVASGQRTAVESRFIERCAP